MWAGTTIAAAAGLAIVQVPGGMWAVPDPEARLQVGDSTMIVWSTPAEAPAPGLRFGPFEVVRSGNAAILRSGAAAYPLLLRPNEALPDVVIFTIATDPAEYDEGVLPSPADDPCPCAPVSREEALAHLCAECGAPRPPVSRAAALDFLHNDCEPACAADDARHLPPCSSADALLFLLFDSLTPQETP